MDDDAKKVLEAMRHEDEHDENLYEELSTELLMSIEGKPIDYVIPILSSILSVLILHRVGAEAGSEFFTKLSAEIVDDEDIIRRASGTLFGDGKTGTKH